MNKKHNLDLHGNRSFIQFMLRAQQLAQQETRSDKGYAMMMTSIVSILMFSMLAAYMTMTNLSKSSTNAYVDTNNTFYASEAGLNRRAEQLRQKFIGYASPSTGSTAAPSGISSCYSVLTTAAMTNNDFECRNYAFRYRNNSSTVKSSSSESLGGGIEVSDRNDTVSYVAYTYVADRTQYSTGGTSAPIPKRIPAGETYAGLNAQEYKYTVYSTAKKPNSVNATATATLTPAEIDARNRKTTHAEIAGDDALVASADAKEAQADATNAASAANTSNVETVLQMDFKSRVIPLFQFAAFYNRDLELNSTSAMVVDGWVHTNANLYIQPTPTNPANPGTDFKSNLTAAGDIYNRVDASTITRNGAARVLMTSSPDTFLSLPNYNSARTTSITAAEMTPFGGKVLNGTGGAVTLNPPDAGFMRKRNYSDNKVGEYFGKADLRLEMVPDRLVPFNFTAIQSGANATGGTCDTTSPAAGSDPAANYIDPERQGTNFKCTQLSKGQLLSLAQPVLVLTRGNTEEETRFCAASIAPTIDRSRDIIDYSNTAAFTGLTTTQADKVLRALQVAISSYELPLDYDIVTDPGTSKLPTTVKDNFETLLKDPTFNIGLSLSQISNLKTASPASIAKARQSCFLPAPVQRIVKGTGTVSDGFYDRRENRQLTMLQTNIESLTIWNRDGRYVDMGTNLNANIAATSASLLAALNSGDPSNPATADTYSTNNLLFIKAAASGTNTGSFEKLGLAAADTSEGGLVLHATVNDDLDGNGTIDPATEVRGDSTQPIYKKNADGTNFVDGSGNLVVMDYYRRYKNGNTRQSPYGFAFNGGKNLPGALTVVTDQGVYVQGDYNSYPNAKKPASILADTITALSVNCVSSDTATDPTNVWTGQINCGIPAGTGGTRPWTASGNVNPVNSGSGSMYDARETTVNAAFLSYTDQSNGNLGVGRGFGGTKVFSGGLNNYMRMVESWNGQAYNYGGSFISLGNPLEFSGNYVFAGGAASYYWIPIRNFSYDTSFNSFDLLPPLTPRAIYLQQQVFKRSYKSGSL
jgi:hypothetical protein